LPYPFSGYGWMVKPKHKGDKMTHTKQGLKLYERVTATKSNSSYGRWAVRTSDATFRFFWKKKEADAFVNAYNNGDRSGYSD